MATEYENYVTGDDSNHAFYATLGWIAQTFTVDTNHVISSVKVKLLRYAGSVPGILTAVIQAVDGSSKPTGSALATGTYAAVLANVITTAGDGEFIEISFSTGALLLAGTEYALTMKSSTDDVTKPIYWRFDNADSSYTDGQAWLTADSGTSWTSKGTGDDFLFADWGDPQGSGEGGSIYPSDAITRVTSLIHRYDRGTYTLEVNLGEVVADFGLPEITKKPQPSVPEEEPVVKPAEEPYPFTSPEVMQPLYEAEAKRRQRQAEELGIGGAPTARSIRIQVEEADKIAILQEIERLSRSAMAPGITPYARDVLQRAIVRKQDELRALYNQ